MPVVIQLEGNVD
jgi:hypothetical protein